MTESTAASTEEQIDGALIDDKRIGRRMRKSFSNRTFSPDWNWIQKSKRAPDDGKHWQPPPGPLCSALITRPHVYPAFRVKFSKGLRD